MNEAEVRAAIVDVWLRNHGFTDAELLLERTFSIRLGHAVIRVGGQVSSGNVAGRADYLVRSTDGRNLLIIEAKAAGVILDDETDAQAVSYARLLADGGIAPFAIVTNGSDTHILDAITGDRLNEVSIPLTHTHVLNGFVVSSEDLFSRADAIEHLIGLSSTNLKAFCNAQVRHTMCALRSELLDSGMKYIPSLYTPRTRESDALSRLLSESKQCILVVGPPQVGKTNFICHTVEALLEADVPCLFYPAVGLGAGVLDAIRNDFAWSFQDTDSALHVARRLARVVRRVGKALTLFVDGINENLDFVRAFNLELERLQELDIIVVVSLTSYSAATVLLDPFGNVSASARSAGLKKSDILTIELGGTSSSDKLSLVDISHYTSAETDAAYEKYAHAYHVAVPEDHEKTQDPQLLRSAMEVYHDRQLPTRLEAKDILSAIIREKLSRLGGMDHHLGQAVLDEVARRLSQESAIGLSSFAPQVCLVGIGKALMMADENLKHVIKSAFQPAFNSAVEEILDEFYGRSSMGMCPCFLDSLEGDADALRREYDLLHGSTQTAQRFYYELPTTRELHELLILLNPLHKLDSPPDQLQIKIPFKP